MVVYSHSKRIDFKTNVDWQERQQLLRTSFDVDIRSAVATYNIQFGNVKRHTHWNTSWDMARFESVAHQWVDFSQHDYGVALLNDCKYGHSVKDNTISLSLLKGPIYPDPDGDIGKHELTYSLLPHKGDFVTGNVSQEAWSLNSPMAVYKGRTDIDTFIKINPQDPISIDAIKLKEDGEGIILRLHDHIESGRLITLEPQFEFYSWQETNLMEEAIGEEMLNTDGKIHLQLTPYEIKTIWIKQTKSNI
jgi:alpha-mannosidase